MDFLNALANMMGAKAPSEPVLREKVDTRMLESFKKIAPWLPVESPDELMKYIDVVTASENRSSGSPDLYRVKKAQEALGMIYGINDYTPKGFEKWSDEQRRWYNPRLSSGGVDSEAGEKTGGLMRDYANLPLKIHPKK